MHTYIGEQLPHLYIHTHVYNSHTHIYTCIYIYIQAAKLHMERQLEIISNCYGASERIVRSNVPAAYSRHTSRFLSMWCFTLPFVLVHSLQWQMIPTVALICWSLFVIEEVGHCVEDPFNVHM